MRAARGHACYGAFVDNYMLCLAARVGAGDHTISLTHQLVDVAFRKAGNIPLLVQHLGARLNLDIVQGGRAAHHIGVGLRLVRVLLAGAIEATIDTALFALLLTTCADNLNILLAHAWIAGTMNDHHAILRDLSLSVLAILLGRIA